MVVVQFIRSKNTAQKPAHLADRLLVASTGLGYGSRDAPAFGRLNLVVSYHQVSFSRVHQLSRSHPSRHAATPSPPSAPPVLGSSLSLPISDGRKSNSIPADYCRQLPLYREFGVGLVALEELGLPK